MEYQIYTDSTVDLPADLIEKLNIRVMNLSYTIDGVIYKNDLINPEFTPHEFYDIVKSGNDCKTNHLYEADIIDEFRKSLENNIDILYISFSQALSETYKSANNARKILLNDYCDRKIKIIDSRAASMGEGLLVYMACQMRDKGYSIDELADWIENNKLRIHHWFTVDSISNLRRGGRLSFSKSIIARTLSVKPILCIDGIGKLILKNYVVGRKKSIKILVEKMKRDYVEGTPVFISHGDALNEAMYLKKMIKEAFNVDQIFINYIGPVIGAHSGKGAIALFYYGISNRFNEE